MSEQAFILQFRQMPESLKKELWDYLQYLLSKSRAEKPSPTPSEDGFSALQNLLLAAPPLNDEDLETIEQKRESLNAWKPSSSTPAS